MVLPARPRAFTYRKRTNYIRPSTTGVGRHRPLGHLTRAPNPRRIESPTRRGSSMSTTYATLTEALADIARRSFYESATVTPNEDGSYTVEDDVAYLDDTVTWSYGGGLELPYGAPDYSRVPEPAEYYDAAAHVEYNLPGAVDTLREGKAVHFSYVVVDAYPEADDEDGEDRTVGWALVAFYA